MPTIWIWVAFSKRSSDDLADRTATRGFSLVSRALQGVLDSSDREEADGPEGQEGQEEEEEERERTRARLARQLSTETQTRKLPNTASLHPEVHATFDAFRATLANRAPEGRHILRRRAAATRVRG